SKSELVVLNPGAANSNVTITVFNDGGDQIGTVLSQVIAGHAALRVSPSAMGAAGAGTLSARITASSPVAATAIIDRGDSMLFASGQSVEQTGSLRVAPHFVSGGRFDSVLALTNPTGSAVTVAVTLFRDSNSPATKSFTIPQNGTLLTDARRLM